MRKIVCPNATKACANLIFLGVILSILFGHGVHFHTIFDHLFDHGDIHIFVHSHSHSSGQDHEDSFGYDLEDSHIHPISTVSLKSVRTTSQQQKVVQLTQLFISVVSVASTSNTDDLLPTYLDLPPPSLISDLCHCYSFSLRAPPVG